MARDNSQILNILNSAKSLKTDKFGMPQIRYDTPSAPQQTNSVTIPSTGTNTGGKTAGKVTDVTPKTDNNEIEVLKRDFKSLKGAFYKNNFPTSQKFTKSTQFTNTLMLPVYATAPAVCEQGQVYVNSGTGKLYVCSATNTWTIVGTQS